LGPSVVANPSRAATTLGDDARRRRTNPRQCRGDAGREDYPLPLSDHINKFLFEEVNMIRAGLVGSALDGSAELGGSPRRRGELDRHPAVLVELEKALGRVVNLGEAGEVTASAALLYECGPPLRLQLSDVAPNELT